MKASEETIFPVCDAFFEQHHRTPSADEVIAISGGGKKEVLKIKKKWESLHYLKENDLDIPTRWLSHLGEFFKEAKTDIAVEKASLKEEYTSAIDELKNTI